MKRIKIYGFRRESLHKLLSEHAKVLELQIDTLELEEEADSLATFKTPKLNALSLGELLNRLDTSLTLFLFLTDLVELIN